MYNKSQITFIDIRGDYSLSDPIVTIKQEHTIENVISKSRFIAHIKPVFSEDKAKQFINQIKQQHKEATHNCSAYTIGDQMNIQKANDDGCLLYTSDAADE